MFAGYSLLPASSTYCSWWDTLNDYQVNYLDVSQLQKIIQKIVHTWIVLIRDQSALLCELVENALGQVDPVRQKQFLKTLLQHKKMLILQYATLYKT